MTKLQIVEEMMSSNFVAKNFKATYVCIVRVEKLIRKCHSVPPLLEKFGKKVLAAECVEITHLDDPGLDIPFEEDIIFLSQATDTSVKNNDKPGFSVANFFLRHSRVFRNKLHYCNLEQAKEKLPKFALFSAAMSLQSRNIHYVIMSLYMSNMKRSVSW